MARAKRQKAVRGPTLLDRAAAGIRWVIRWALRAALAAAVLLLLWVAIYGRVDPPGTPYIWSEASRLGGVAREWRDIDDIAPVMARAAVAAEDADFCLHWGFDVDAIRAAIEDGASRGGSTISQQVVKNAFLWQGRSWTRKALEGVLTPAMEAMWSKRRILEVYLNVAEFGEGVFGVEAAARHYYGISADALSAGQAAALASVLPSPKRRDPRALSPGLRQKAAQVADGAATIRADGRAACFED